MIHAFVGICIKGVIMKTCGNMKKCLCFKLTCFFKVVYVIAAMKTDKHGMMGKVVNN